MEKRTTNFGRYHRLVVLAVVAMSASLSGCTALLSPIDTVPANRVPPQFLAEPQTNKVNLDPSRLRQDKPEYYILDKGDVMGVFIESVLGNIAEAPPVQLPGPDSDLPPAIGYPVPIREDGTVSLPLVKPIPLAGLTIQQAEQLIKRAYRGGPAPLLKEDIRIIVTLLRERTHRVFVVRQDNTAQNSAQFASQRAFRAVTDRSDESARGFVLQLPAYKNDVLNALSQTGGLPGVNAKAEIRILRGDRLAIGERDRMVADFYRSNQADAFPYGEMPTIEDETSSIRIPLRLKPGEVPQFTQDDIILRDGDIVMVENRDTDVYYTGGLLGGGEYNLPRDYDLDVLGAVAIAGQGFAVGQNSGGGGLGVPTSTVPPTQLIVLRRLPGDRQIAIRVDMTVAINDPKARLLVKPGDTLILRYKPQEELVNFAIGTFFTYGVRQLFSN